MFELSSSFQSPVKREGYLGLNVTLICETFSKVG